MIDTIKSKITKQIDKRQNKKRDTTHKFTQQPREENGDQQLNV